MPYIPKAPASCAHSTFAVVERTLTKHYGDIRAAARELGVSVPDLRRLTWSKPELLEEAQIECLLFVSGGCCLKCSTAPIRGVGNVRRTRLCRRMRRAVTRLPRRGVDGETTTEILATA
jgi:hypothetical protein